MVQKILTSNLKLQYFDFTQSFLYKSLLNTMINSSFYVYEKTKCWKIRACKIFMQMFSSR